MSCDDAEESACVERRGLLLRSCLFVAEAESRAKSRPCLHFFLSEPLPKPCRESLTLFSRETETDAQLYSTAQYSTVLSAHAQPLCRPFMWSCALHTAAWLGLGWLCRAHSSHVRLLSSDSASNHIHLQIHSHCPVSEGTSLFDRVLFLCSQCQIPRPTFRSPTSLHRRTSCSTLLPQTIQVAAAALQTWPTMAHPPLSARTTLAHPPTHS